MKNWLSSGVVLMGISLTLYFSMGYEVSISQMADVTLDEENVFSEDEDVVEDTDTLGEDEDLDDEELGSIDTAETQEVVTEVFSTELVENVKTVSETEAESLGEGNTDEGIDAADLGEKVFSTRKRQAGEEDLGMEEGPEVFSSDDLGASEDLSGDEEDLDEDIEDEEMTENTVDAVGPESASQTGGVFSSVNKVGTKDEVVSSDEVEAPKPKDLATVPPTETKKTSKKSPKAQRVKTKADEYYEITPGVYSEIDEKVKLVIDNVNKVNIVTDIVGGKESTEEEWEEEVVPDVFTEKDEDIKVVYDNVNFTDPNVKEEFYEPVKNVVSSKDEMVKLEYDNVNYVDPNANKEEVEAYVVRSKYAENPGEGNIISDSKDAELGIPYKAAAYTTESAAKTSMKGRSLGTPYTIRTKKQQEAINRGY